MTVFGGQECLTWALGNDDAKRSFLQSQAMSRKFHPIFPGRNPRPGTAVLSASGDGQRVMVTSFDPLLAAYPNYVSTQPTGSPHAAVLCADTGVVLALCGPAGHRESDDLATRYAEAQNLLAACEGLLHCLYRATDDATRTAEQKAAIDAATGANDPRNYDASAADGPDTPMPPDEPMRPGAHDNASA